MNYLIKCNCELFDDVKLMCYLTLCNWCAI